MQCCRCCHGRGLAFYHGGWIAFRLGVNWTMCVTCEHGKALEPVWRDCEGQCFRAMVVWGCQPLASCAGSSTCVKHAMNAARQRLQLVCPCTGVRTCQSLPVAATLQDSVCSLCALYGRAYMSVFACCRRVNTVRFNNKGRCSACDKHSAVSSSQQSTDTTYLSCGEQPMDA
jgi:hypothetical protein